MSVQAAEAATTDLHAAEQHGKEELQNAVAAAQAAEEQLRQRVAALEAELASVAAFKERQQAMAVDAVVLQEGITQLQAEMLEQARAHDACPFKQIPERALHRISDNAILTGS